MKYTEFVKANYSKVSDLPAKQRMAKLGQMWRASGKGVVGGSEGGMFIKRKSGHKGKKGVKGKGLLSGPLSIFGLGFPEGDDKGGDVAGGRMRKVKGKGLISDTLGAFGLGVKKRGRPAKGKGVAGGKFGAFHNDVALANGGGFFSNALSAFGLGIPDKVKQKHYNKMVALEKQLHSKGKLTPVQHNKLKVYHTLHGAGFFDSLWRGIKSGASAVVSAVPKAISTIGQVAKIVPEITRFVPEVAKFVPAVGKLAEPLAKIAPLAAML